MLEIAVSYEPVDNSVSDEIVESLCERFEGRTGDSGCGLGHRDIWCLIPESQGLNFAIAVSEHEDLKLHSIRRLS